MLSTPATSAPCAIFRVAVAADTKTSPNALSKAIVLAGLGPDPRNPAEHCREVRVVCDACGVVLATFFAYLGTRANLASKVSKETDLHNQMASRTCANHAKRHLLQPQPAAKASLPARSEVAATMPTMATFAAASRKRARDESDACDVAANASKRLAVHPVRLAPAPPYVMIDSVELEPAAATHSSDEATPTSGIELSSELDEELDEMAESEDDEAEAAAVRLSQERQCAVSALKDKYRRFHERRALDRRQIIDAHESNEQAAESSNSAAVTELRSEEWSDGKQQWCPCGCGDLWIDNAYSYENSDYVYDGEETARIEQPPSSAGTRTTADLVAALFCPHSQLKGVSWEVKSESGYDLGICNLDGDVLPMDTDMYGNRVRVHTMTLMAQPLVAAFERLCVVLGFDPDDRDCEDEHDDGPVACTLDATQQLEDLVTEQLLTRWKNQEEGAQVVVTVLSMLVATFESLSEHLLPRGFVTHSPAHHAVVRLLCGALRRVMAQPLDDGHWFDLTASPQLLILSLQAIGTRHAYAPKFQTDDERMIEAQRLSIQFGGKFGGKGGRGKSSRFTRVALCSSPAVRCTLMPLLLGAPADFCPRYVSSAWAEELNYGLFDGALLAEVGKKVRQQKDTSLRLTWEEVMAAESTARLLARINSELFPDNHWPLNTLDTQLFCKLAATVPGVGAALRSLIVLERKA